MSSGGSNRSLPSSVASSVKSIEVKDSTAESLYNACEIAHYNIQHSYDTLPRSHIARLKRNLLLLERVYAQRTEEEKMIEHGEDENESDEVANAEEEWSASAIPATEVEEASMTPPHVVLTDQEEAELREVGQATEEYIGGIAEQMVLLARQGNRDPIEIRRGAFVRGQQGLDGGLERDSIDRQILLPSPARSETDQDELMLDVEDRDAHTLANNPASPSPLPIVYNPPIIAALFSPERQSSSFSSSSPRLSPSPSPSPRTNARTLSSDYVSAFDSDDNVDPDAPPPQQEMRSSGSRSYIAMRKAPLLPSSESESFLTSPPYVEEAEENSADEEEESLDAESEDANEEEEEEDESDFNTTPKPMDVVVLNDSSDEDAPDVVGDDSMSGLSRSTNREDNNFETAERGASTQYGSILADAIALVSQEEHYTSVAGSSVNDEENDSQRSDEDQADQEELDRDELEADELVDDGSIIDDESSGVVEGAVVAQLEGEVSFTHSSFSRYYFLPLESDYKRFTPFIRSMKIRWLGYSNHQMPFFLLCVIYSALAFDLRRRC